MLRLCKRIKFYNYYTSLLRIYHLGYIVLYCSFIAKALLKTNVLSNTLYIKYTDINVNVEVLSKNLHNMNSITYTVYNEIKIYLCYFKILYFLTILILYSNNDKYILPPIFWMPQNKFISDCIYLPFSLFFIFTKSILIEFYITAKLIIKW